MKRLAEVVEVDQLLWSWAFLLSYSEVPRPVWKLQPERLFACDRRVEFWAEEEREEGWQEGFRKGY